MRTLCSLMLTALVLVGCAPEPLPDREAALASLVAAERAFAQMSVEEMIYLMQRRVEVMDALVGVHTTKSTYIGF